MENKISATVIQDSITGFGVRLTTLKLTYPRFIHAEFMTHRVFSRNTASSRAVPISKMLNHVTESPAMPVHWGKNTSGMQAREELQGEAKEAAKRAWLEAMLKAVASAESLMGSGVHKQIANRVTEPFQMHHAIVSATEFSNFLFLRNHPDAQPEIQELAKCIEFALLTSSPSILKAGQWHVPFVNRVFSDGGIMYTDTLTNEVLTEEQAKKISASCCAQVSFRMEDRSLEKAERIAERLISSTPRHSSPWEHQATPFTDYDWGYRNKLLAEAKFNLSNPKGAEQILFCGNFRGWIQGRKLIPDENFLSYMLGISETNQKDG